MSNRALARDIETSTPFRLNFLQDATKGIGLLFGINHTFRLGRIAFFYGAGYRF